MAGASFDRLTAFQIHLTGVIIHPKEERMI